MQPAETWNRFINKIIEAKALWKEHQELCMSTRTMSDPSTIMEARILSATFNRAEFDIALPRIIDFWRGYGGLDALVITSSGSKNEPVETKGKEDLEDEQPTRAAGRSRSR